MKKTFLKYDKPPLTVMVQVETPDEAVEIITEALYDGAEAFGIQLCCLKKEYRNEDDIKKIFSACRNKPIYITSYLYGYSKGNSYEESTELLLLGLKCGATLCDVMGDLYHAEPHELTFDPEAVKKQRELIDKIHSLGGEVLISSHLHTFFEEEEIIRYAKEQIARGADIVKIVSFAEDEEQLLADLKICAHLKNKIDRPYLFLANGRSSGLLRQIGANLGNCMYLCQQRYTPLSAKEQPLLRAVKQVRDNIVL